MQCDVRDDSLRVYTQPKSTFHSHTDLNANLIDTLIAQMHVHYLLKVAT